MVLRAADFTLPVSGRPSRARDDAQRGLDVEATFLQVVQRVRDQGIDELDWVPTFVRRGRAGTVRGGRRRGHNGKRYPRYCPAASIVLT